MRTAGSSYASSARSTRRSTCNRMHPGCNHTCGGCNCVDPGCSHIVLERAEVGPRAAATPPLRGARQRRACGPWCAAWPPPPRRRAPPRRRTSCRAARRSDRAHAAAPRRPRAPARVLGRQVQMVTTCMHARVHACRSAPPTRPRTAPSAAARGPRAAARPRPRPRAPRAPGTWGGSLGYMGSQPRVHGPQPLAH